MSEEEKKRDKLIYEIIISRYDQELERTNDLDSKASNVTGFAGLLVTLMAVIIQFLPQFKNVYLFLIPLILLIISAILGLWAYWIKSYSAIQPIALIQEYKDSSETKLLREFTATTAQNTMHNHSVNEEKVLLIRSAFILLILAISLFFAVTIVNLRT